MAMLMYMQGTSGYSNGVLQLDYTFKICKEKTPFFVASVTVRCDAATSAPRPLPSLSLSLSLPRTASHRTASHRIAPHRTALTCVTPPHPPLSPLISACLCCSAVVQDIAQHGKPTAFGPASHEDTAMVKVITKSIKDFADLILAALNDNIFPQGWAAHLRAAVVQKYGYLFAADAEPPELEIAKGMTDNAPALPAGMFAGMGIQSAETCYVHFWRALKPNYNKLKTNTEERQNLLYEDITFLYNYTDVSLLTHGKRLFCEKWEGNLGETDLIN